MKILHKFELKNKDGDYIEYGIKKPSRMESDEEQMFRSIEMSKCMKRGILTREMMVKEYLNIGGVFADVEKDEIKAAYEKIYSIETEFKFLSAKNKKSKEDEAKIKELEEDYSECVRLVADFEQKQEGVLNNSADAIAKNKSITWLFTQVFYKRPRPEEEKDDTTWEKVFPYNSANGNLAEHEKNLDFYADVFEEDDVSLREALIRGLTILSCWMHSKNVTEDDLKRIDKQFEQERHDEEAVVETEAKPRKSRVKKDKGLKAEEEPKADETHDE